MGLPALDHPSVEIVEEVKSKIRDGLLEMNQPCDRVLVTDAKLPVDPRHNSKIDYQKAKELIPKLSWPETL